MRALSIIILGTGLATNLAACDSRAKLVGSWDLWSIDGMPVADAIPEISEPPLADYAGIPLESGDIRSEVKPMSRSLQLYPDGEYLDEAVVERTWLLSTRLRAALEASMTGRADGLQKTPG